jgi:hypothetical protein
MEYTVPKAGRIDVVQYLIAQMLLEAEECEGVGPGTPPTVPEFPTCCML